MVVNHIDLNKHNNCVENLEWATRCANMQHAHDNGMIATHRGRPVESIDPVTEEIVRYASIHDGAKAVGGSGSNIGRVLDHPTHTVKGLRWRSCAEEEVEDEEWRAVREVNGVAFDHIAYEVSSLGRIRNNKNLILRPQRIRQFDHVSLKTSANATKNLLVHHVVAAAFLPPPREPGMWLMHLEGDSNAAHNLEWRTKREAMTKVRGTPVLQLTLDGELVAEHQTQTAAAEAAGLSQAAVNQAIRKGGTSGGYRWQKKGADAPDPAPAREAPAPVREAVPTLARGAKAERTVQQLTLEGVLVAEHRNQTAAAAAVQLTQSAISSAILKGGISGGYRWRKKAPVEETAA